MTTKTNKRLQEVIGGCFVWEEAPEGWIRIDFYDSLDLAQRAFPEATLEALPAALITDLETP